MAHHDVRLHYSDTAGRCTIVSLDVGRVTVGFFSFVRSSTQRMGLLNINAGIVRPQYYEIYQLREVVGISMSFMAVDILGGVFSLASLFFRTELDRLAVVSRIEQITGVHTRLLLFSLSLTTARFITQSHHVEDNELIRLSGTGFLWSCCCPGRDSSHPRRHPQSYCQSSGKARRRQRRGPRR